jgi:hypothetical protein
MLYVDVKPENFMIGYGEKAQVVHLVDFEYVYDVGTLHPKAGSLLYNSCRVLAGQGAAASITGSLAYMHGVKTDVSFPFAALTPKGDLESIGYVIAALYYGTLPWLQPIEELARAHPNWSSEKMYVGAGPRVLELKQSAELFPDFPGIVHFA